MDEAAARAGFREIREADERAGRERQLEEYQRLFPGYEDAIADEFNVSVWDVGSRPDPAPIPEDEPDDDDDVEDDEVSQLVGPYRVVEQIGQGGQGLVFLAEDMRLGRKVALKTLGPSLDPTFVDRFKREAAAASRLDHPGICAVYGTGEADGTHYIAMRYVEGESLAEKIANAQASAPGPDDSIGPSTRRGVDATLELIEKAARALHAAHEAGIVHRDIKPGNVMVDPAGEPVLLDFGLAADETGDLRTLTAHGDLMGTPAYMSPEQLTAHRIKLDRRTDIYSLAVTLYECLTLKRPFEAPTLEGIYKQILANDPPDPRRENRHIPRDVKVILETALEKDRERRYATALDFAEDLRRARKLEPIQAKPIGSMTRAWRWAQRRPALAASLTGLFLALSAGLVGAILLTKKANRERDEADRQRVEANRLRKAADAAFIRATGLRLVAQAKLLVDKDPGTALLLAVEGAKRLDETASELANDALRSCLDACREERTLLGHTGWVHSAEFSPDGRRVVTAGEDWTVRTWDATNGTELRKVEHADAVLWAGYSPDGRLILSVSNDRTARLWDASTGTQVHLLGGHEGSVNAGAFSPDGARVATAGDDGHVRVWDTASGRLVRQLDARNYLLKGSVAFSPEFPILAAGAGGSHASGLWLWNTTDWSRINVDVPRWGVAEVYGLSFEPAASGRRLFMLRDAGPQRPGVNVWKRAPSGYVEAWHSRLTARAVRVDDRGRVLLALHDGTAAIVEFVDKEPVVKVALRGHGWGRVNWAAFSPDGTRAVTAGDDATARIWRVSPPCWSRAKRLFPGSFSPDGRLVAVGSTLFDVESGRQVLTLADGPEAAIFTGDGKQLIGLGKKAGLWDVATGKLVTRLRDATLPIPGPGVRVFDANGLVYAQEHRDLLSWDTKTGRSRKHNRRTRVVDAQTGHILELNGPRVSILRLSDGTTRDVTLAGARRPDTAVIAFDGKLLAGDLDRVALWDLDTGKLIRKLPWDDGYPTIVSCASNGLRAVGVEEYGNIANVYVWNLRSGDTLCKVTLSVTVRSASLSPDGRRLLVVTKDDAAQQIDAETGNTVQRVKRVSDAFFTGDGRWLVCNTADGPRLLNPDPLEEAESRRPRDLTEKERAKYDLLSEEEAAARKARKELNAEAHELVDSMLNELHYAVAVENALRTKEGLTPELRVAAIRRARNAQDKLPALPDGMDAELARPDNPERDRILENVLVHLRGSPHMGLWSSAGIGLYRAGRYEEARRHLERSRALERRWKSERPCLATVVFLAMTYVQLNDKAAARALLDGLPDHKKAREAQVPPLDLGLPEKDYDTYLEEARALLGGAER